jgi:hypothetical protein
MESDVQRIIADPTLSVQAKVILAARDTSRHFPSKVHQQRLTVREYKARLEAGEISDDGIFRAKQARRPRHLRVEASKYEQASDIS